MMKGELEELGEESEGLESISKIQTQILNLTKGNVNIFDDTGNFKSTYEILKGISEVWDHISQVDQAALLETISGKQRANSAAALIQAFKSGQVDKALIASRNSDGSALEEQERYMTSLKAKIDQFKAAFQGLSNTVISSDVLKFFVDLGTTGLQGLDGLINGLGQLPALLATIAGGMSAFKNVGRLKCA